MAKLSWLIAESETDFQYFLLFYISLRDEPRLGHSSDCDQDALRELVEWNLRKSTWELALDLNTSQSTICRHKLGVWVPHTLREKNKEDHISITSFLSRQRNDWIDKDESLRNFMEEKLCCVYGGITKVSFPLSF